MSTHHKHSAITRYRYSVRRAFTLVELVASMAVMTILMAGMGSAIMIATNALPDASSPLATSRAGRTIADQITGDLLCATAVTTMAPNTITFIVADRNHGDPGPETITYAWSGTPGDPLTWQYNGGTIVDLVEDVHEFDLSYATRSVTTNETVTSITASGEVLLAFFEDWAGKTETPQNFGVDSSFWAAEFFSATIIPIDASKVTITRALLKMRQGALGGAGTFSVAIHRSKGGGNPEPTTTPLGTPVVGSGTNLSDSYRWEAFTFADVSLKNANKEYVIVVSGASAGTQGDAEILRYYANKAPKIDSNALWTSDGGANWGPKKNVANCYQFPFYVYGTYETTTSAQIDVTRYYLDSVGIKLRIGADAVSRANTTIQVLNTPEVAAP